MTLDHNLKKMGFMQISSDPCLYVSSEGEFFIIAVYVSDILLAGKTNKREEQVKKGFSSHFNVKDLGQLSYFLGVTVNHNHAEGSIWIGQPTYMSNVLEKLGMKDSTPACCYICQCWFKASKSYRTR